MRALSALALLFVVAIALRGELAAVFARPVVATWSTIFVAVTVQALPFLVLGVLVSGSIAAFVPAGLLARAVPRRPFLAVPLAAAAGMALPGCECSSVPVARRLMDRGVTPPAALAFLLSAPSVNPVVLVATAVAFPHHPRMVLARLFAGLLAATAVGLAWSALGDRRTLPLLRPSRVPQEHSGRPWNRFLQAAEHDLLPAGGFLVIGAAAAATLQTVVPRTILGSFGPGSWWSVPALGALAVVLAVCSEADAFIAASLRQFSPTAQLAFMVVGPMIDLKLAALQVGTFGRRFALVFAPMTFTVALASATAVGVWLR